MIQPASAAKHDLKPGWRLPLPSRPFVRFLARRLAALILLGVGITFVAFVLTELVPGDPAAANLGQRAIADPAVVQAFREHYGLDKPLPVQYVVYLEHLVQGDLGQSEQSHRSVRADLAEFVPATAELAVTSILIAYVLGITLGVISAVRRNK
ncbi:MAG TPA: ABC transporter permease, partial [Acidimicrobiales bacterium]